MSITATALRIDSRTMLIVRKTEENPLQLSLFTDYKTQWMHRLLENAHRFNGPFWFSELRALTTDTPASPNWYGLASKQLTKNGFVQTGKYQASIIASRKGGVDFQWVYKGK